MRFPLRFLLPLPGLVYMFIVLAGGDFVDPQTGEEYTLWFFGVHSLMVGLYYFALSDLGRRFFTFPAYAGLRLVHSSGAGEDAVIMFLVRATALSAVYGFPYLVSGMTFAS